ncbi:unnamed protein product [Linum trigynum]|uniref:Uncharacterized protein n=1 Tax=Linum trigynum TaxID=586398 RepID=A0AAV2GL81_9ROSI
MQLRRNPPCFASAVDFAFGLHLPVRHRHEDALFVVAAQVATPSTLDSVSSSSFANGSSCPLHGSHP